MKRDLLTWCITAIIIQPASNFTKAQSVDNFTGNLEYRLDLLTLPSSDGPSVPIYMTYRSDVGVEQDAGPVGLGWALSAGGEIVRSVNVIPDDWYEVETFLSNDTILKTASGVLHFGSRGHLADITNHDFKNQGNTSSISHSFFPALDNYYVNAPALNGQIKPYLLEYARLEYDVVDGAIEPIDENFSKKPQFAFPHDFFTNIESDYFPWQYSPISDCPYGVPELVVPAPMDGKEDFKGPGYNDNSYPIVHNKNRLRTGRYVEYFTNEEINEHKSDVAAMPGGFVEYASSVSRPTNKHIGAFRITDENGYTYHFSLPVYSHSRTNGNYELDYAYVARDHTSMVQKTQYAKDSYIWQEDTTRRVQEWRQAEPYVIKWLLTGITGVDYKDEGNGYIDAGDAGYWVLFKYQLLDDQFVNRAPFVGHTRYYSAYDGHESIAFNARMEYNNLEKNTFRIGRFYTEIVQAYYLDEIETNTHKVVFSTFSRQDVIEQDTNYDDTGSDTYAGTRLLGYDSLLLIEKNLDEPVQSVHFVQDYSLAKGWYQNANVTLPSSDKFTSAPEIQTSVSYSGPNTGKLTLLEVEFLNRSGNKNHPDYEFGYALTEGQNPDYNALKTDFWGFYKNSSETNGLSGYATSETDPAAWNLRSILLPGGGEIQVVYEADRYGEVLNMRPDGDESHGPYRVFAISSANIISPYTGSNWEVELESNRTDFETLFEEVSDSATFTTIVPFTHIDATCYCWNSTVYDDTTFSQKKAVRKESVTAADLDLTSYPYEFNKCALNSLNQEIDLLDSISIYPEDLGNCYSNDSCYAGAFYNGNGFISINFEKGFEVYGGGSRVRENKYIESPSGNTFVQRFTYEEGVATVDLSHFDRPNHTEEYLLSHNYHSPLELPANVGYGKVTIENLGLENQSENQSVYLYNTLPADDDIMYYQPFFLDKIGCSNSDDFVDGIEYIDKFSNYFGTIREANLFDKTGQLLSASVYEYEFPTEGSELESYYSYYNADPPNDPEHYLTLIRRFSTRTKSIRTFEEGLWAYTLIDTHDPYTGQATEETIYRGDLLVDKRFKTYAHDVSSYFHFGPKTDRWSNLNLLGREYEIRDFRDVDLITNGDFYSLERKYWSTFASVRSYDETANEYVTTLRPVAPYLKRQYMWKGPLGDYGIYKGSSYEHFLNGSDLSPAWLTGLGLTIYENDGWLSFEEGTPVGPEILEESQVILVDKSAFDDAFGLNPTLSESVYLIDKLPYDDTDGLFAEDIFTATDVVLYEEDSIIVADDREKFNANWKVLGYSTLLDARHHVLEARNEKGESVSARYRHQNSFSYANAANASFMEFTATGFEEVEESETGFYFVEGEVKVSDAVLENPTINDTLNLQPHSGHYYLRLYTDAEVAYQFNDTEGLMPDKTYKAQVWMHENTCTTAVFTMFTTGLSPDVSVSTDVSDTGAVEVGEWKLITIELTMPSSVTDGTLHLEIRANSCPAGGMIDDLRFHPSEAKVNVNINDPVSGLPMAILNSENFSTEFYYDSRDKLTEIYREVPGLSKVKVTSKEYNFQRTY